MLLLLLLPLPLKSQKKKKQQKSRSPTIYYDMFTHKLIFTGFLHHTGAANCHDYNGLCALLRQSLPAGQGPSARQGLQESGNEPVVTVPVSSTTREPVDLSNVNAGSLVRGA